MNKIERTYLFVVLAFIAIALAILAFGSLQAAQARQARLAEYERITGFITQTIDEVNAAQKAYQTAAYGSSVDRIAEQQLLATETTNVLLANLASQIGLLAQLQAANP